MAWWKSAFRFALVTALVFPIVLALAIAFVVGPLDYALRYLHFTALSKERLIHQAKVYIRDRAGDDQIACLYVVKCDGVKARLELVSDIAGWDFQAAKDRIWRRRFSDYCPGRTTNFGLHFIPRAGREPDWMYGISNALWSFSTDGFFPQSGRFSGGSFSDQPWEECTPERAIVR